MSHPRLTRRTVVKSNPLGLQPVYHGDRARYHYFQCLQLVLRHQIKALAELWKLPPEFEVRPSLLILGFAIYSSQIVCRDIWALHLSTLPHAISPEPLLHKRDGEPEPPSPTEGFPERQLVDPGQPGDVKDEGSDSGSTNPSASEEGEDPELEALLEQLSASSSEDDDPDLSSAPIEHARSVRKARGKHELPANNVAVLILACWTLRVPVTFRDFTK